MSLGTSDSGITAPMNINAVLAHLVKMSPQQRQAFAQDHSDDPLMLSAAKYVDNQIKDQAKEYMAQQNGAPPKVNQQVVASMAPPQPQPRPQQMAQATLPENSGIAQLPAPNMQHMAGGGIVAFGDGGDIDGYDKGGSIQNAGSDTTAAYKAYAQAKAAKMGVNPALVDSIFNIESGYDPEAKSPTGPVGIGQLTKATGKAYGVRPEDRTDPYKNIDASVAYMADLQRKYGNDPSKIAVAYNQGEPVLDSHLRANGGKLNPATLPKEAKGYLEKLNDLLPMASAQAETLPGRSQAPVRTLNTAADTDAYQADPMNFYIPQQGGAAPSPSSGTAASAAPSGPAKPWYDRAREALTTGEGQRQMLLGLGDIPYDIAGAPADIGSTIGKALGYQSGESSLGSENLKRLGTKYLGREADATDTALQGLRTTGGVAGLMFNPAGTISKLGNAKNLRLAENALQAQKEAEAAQTSVSLPRLENPAGNPTMVGNTAGNISTAGRISSVDAALADELKARNLADIARVNSEAAQGTLTPAQYAALNARAARAGDVMRGTAVAGQIPQAVQNATNAAAPDASGIAALTGQDRGAYLPEGLPAYEEEQGPPISAMNKPEAQAVTPEAAAVPAKNPDEWTKDDWLALAAGLGQNKSQYLSEALGSGLGALVANRAANRKYAMEKERSASEMALEKAQAAQAASHQGYYDYLTTGAKEAAAAERAGGGAAAAAQRQAAKLIEDHMNKFTNSPTGMMATPQQLELERARVTPIIMANVNAQGGSTMPAVPAAATTTRWSGLQQH